MSEADDDLFTELAKLTAPKTEIITEDGPPIGGCGGGAISTAPNGERFVPGGGVVVLEKKRVGDFDAAVLGFHPDAKNDPAAGAAELDAWLVKNRYAFTPSLRSWVEPYVRNGWVITAFKIAADFKPADNKEPAPAGKATVNLGARPVCMSFKTDRPFFPYREPEDQRDERAKSVPRLLRVFVAAPRRYAGKLGDGTQPWPGKTVWAGEIGPPQWETVFAHAKGLVPTPPDPQGWWLTEFEDRSTPRPGTDEVYLEPSADTSPVSRQPNIIYVHRTPWWYGVLCCGWPLFAALLVYFGVRWSSRRK